MADYSLSDVMEALKNADASGDTEGAQKLASMASELQKAAPKPSAGAAGAQTSAPPAPTSNIISGVKQEAEATIGGLANALASGRSAVQSRILGNPADDPATSYMRGVGKSFNDASAATGYDDGTLESSYDKGGIPGAAAHAAKAFVVNAPHTVASYFPPTRALDFASNLQRNAEDRARNDGRTDGPGFTDYVAAVPAAGVQELASMVGARALVKPAAEAAEGVVVPGVRAALARIGKATATDATTGAVGSEAQYLGTHVGTQQGATPGGAVDSAMEGGAAGLVGGAGVRSGIEAVNRIPFDRTAARALKGEAMIAKLGTNGEDQAASNMRVAQAADALRKQAKDEGTLGTAPQDSNTYKTVQNDLVGNLKVTINSLEDVGDITHEQKSALIGADGGLLDLAEKSNHLFVPGKVNEIVDRLGIEDGVKQGLKDGFRDLNTATYNSMAKNSTGPLEKIANYVATPAGTAAAAGLGLTYGLPYAAAGLAVSHGIKLAGRAGDRLLGNGTVPAEASLTALRAAALKRQSLADAAARDTLGTLRSASDDAVQRQQGLADFKKAADAETAFQKQRDYHAAEAAAKAKLADKLAAPITTKPPLPPSVQAIKDAAAEDRPFSKLSSSYLQGRARSLLKERADQQEASSKEEARKRLMGSVDTGAPALGGFHAEVLKSYRDNGIPATHDLLLEALDNINARGGFSSPEEYQLARAGVRFPNHGDGLSPVFREMDAVLKAKGVGATQDSRAATKADSAIVRAKTRAIVEAAQPKPSPAAPKERPQAPPRPRSAPRAAPAVANANSGVDYPHTAATTAHRARIALEQAVKVAGDRSDLAQMAIHVAGLDTKGAKAQAFAEAVKTFHGDPEASSFVMGPLRTLAHIGGKSEQTANNKAVIKVRSQKKNTP